MNTLHFRQQWRDFRIISGDADSCRQQALDILAGKPALWIGDSAPSGVDACSAGIVATLLGQDVEYLVFDALPGLDADAFAAASGLVRGGGLFLLLTPPLAEWGRPQGASGKANSSIFSQRFATFCSKYRQFSSLPLNDQPPIRGEFVTQGQQEMIAALEKVANGHRKRPLVVIADRGRGKSAAFGMGAAQLLAGGVKEILVTAPRLNATLALFEHAGQALPEATQQRGLLAYGSARLRFVAPDELLKKRPRADLLLVDEAAGIPVPLLEKLLLQYKRIAFATTVHGYEGSGKGFDLRFSRVLDRHRPQWKQLRLYEPVRWASADPLESFSFQTLLLDAEPAVLPEGGSQHLDRLLIRRLPREDLLHDEALLRQVFGLLINAHYRTTPTDLKHLLDAPNLRLWVGWLDALPVAAMLVAREGQLPPELHDKIMQGKRRPAGHLLPLAVATQCGFPEVLNMHCERVVRIAVHPTLQHREIGSQMLAELMNTASRRGVDLLGSSFGATPELLAFWQKNRFQPVRLGFRREASSGSHSVLVLCALSPQGTPIQDQARMQYLAQFPLQLAEVFCALEPALIRSLFSEGEKEIQQPSETDRKSLQAFARGGRQYLDCLAPLYALALHQLRSGSPDTEVFVVKLLQKHSWKDAADALGLSGKKAILEKLRQRVHAFLQF